MLALATTASSLLYHTVSRPSQTQKQFTPGNKFYTTKKVKSNHTITLATVIPIPIHHTEFSILYTCTTQLHVIRLLSYWNPAASLISTVYQLPLSIPLLFQSSFHILVGAMWPQNRTTKNTRKRDLEMEMWTAG